MQALFVDNLTVIDFAYFDPKRGIIGESLILDVELFGELNDEGMLFDFSYVKKRIKSCVDSLVDHKLLIARDHKAVTYEHTPQHLELNLITESGDSYRHISPEQAVFFVSSDIINADTISCAIHDEIKAILPNNVTQIKLKLREENIQHEYFHYSHGLKKHFGDCQRIAHGHRSKIEIWENEQYSSHWSSYIAKKWQDIYLATKEDIKNSQIIDGNEYLVFEYHANQGLFQLTIAKSRCYLIETDTTVELIADYLAKYLKSKQPGSSFKVKAFEGVDKGAIVII